MLISGASGLLLYKTSFEIESSDRIQQPDGKSGLVAGLITALIDFSQKQIQVPFTHMKFETCKFSTMYIRLWIVGVTGSAAHRCL